MKTRRWMPLAAIFGLALGLGGCAVYEPGYGGGYGYAPAYAAPAYGSVNLSFRDGGGYRGGDHGWHGGYRHRGWDRY